MMRFPLSPDLLQRLPRHPDWKYEMIEGEAWLSSRPCPLHLCRPTSLAVPAVTLRAPNRKRFWDAVVVDGVYGETFGQ
jgi:hypothetical protein